MNILGLEISINEIIKFFTLYLCSIFFYFKLNNLKEIQFSKKFIAIIGSLAISIFFSFVSLKVDFAVAFLSAFLLYSLIIKFFIDRKPFTSVMPMIPICLGLGYILLSIAAAIVTTVSMLIYNPEANSNIYEQLAVSLLLVILSISTFKIKRFKNWWYSLQNNKISVGIEIFSITLGTVIISSYNMIKKAGSYDDVSLFLYPTLTIIIVGICLYQWVKKSAEIQYKINLRDSNNKSLQKELDQQNKINAELLNSNNSNAKMNHELNHKLRVLDNMVMDMALMPAVTKRFEKKYGYDFLNLINEVKEVKNSFVINKVEKRVLSSTKVFKIDRTLEQLQLDAIKNNISFEFKINGQISINYIVEEMLSATKISTLLSDHVKNATIAINSSNNPYRAICVVMGEINNGYGIVIYDSGPDFDKIILASLGNKPITTHDKDGGTGYGFMTTFETIRKINASLVIEEFGFSKNSYTKSVGIIFDNKNEYRIKSYREAEIKDINKQKRIKVSKKKDTTKRKSVKV